MQPSSLTPGLKTFRTICWLGVVIWVSTVYYLSSQTSNELMDEFPNMFKLSDKLLHFAAFFSGACALTPALRLTWQWSWKRTILTALIALSVYGALDEVHQMWTPSRSALDPFDWLADTLGAGAGSLVTAFIHARIARRSTHRFAPTGN